MEISKEHRERWKEVTKDGPFNQWLDSLVKNNDGTLNLESLYLVSRAFGINERYEHLNAGQIRMNLGNRLRTVVPESVYTNL